MAATVQHGRRQGTPKTLEVSSPWALPADERWKMSFIALAVVDDPLLGSCGKCCFSLFGQQTAAKPAATLVLKKDEWGRLQDQIKGDEVPWQTKRLAEREQLHQLSQQSVSEWTNTIAVRLRPLAADRLARCFAHSLFPGAATTEAAGQGASRTEGRGERCCACVWLTLVTRLAAACCSVGSLWC
jgi:hypothetical protein